MVGLAFEGEQLVVELEFAVELALVIELELAVEIALAIELELELEADSVLEAEQSFVPVEEVPHCCVLEKEQ